MSRSNISQGQGRVEPPKAVGFAQRRAYIPGIFTLCFLNTLPLHLNEFEMNEFEYIRLLIQPPGKWPTRHSPENRYIGMSVSCVRRLRPIANE